MNFGSEGRVKPACRWPASLESPEIILDFVRFSGRVTRARCRRPELCPRQRHEERVLYRTPPRSHTPLSGCSEGLSWRQIAARLNASPLRRTSHILRPPDAL